MLHDPFRSFLDPRMEPGEVTPTTTPASAPESGDTVEPDPESMEPAAVPADPKAAGLMLPPPPPVPKQNGGFTEPKAAEPKPSEPKQATANLAEPKPKPKAEAKASSSKGVAKALPK